MIVLVNRYLFIFLSKARLLLGFLFLLIISCSRIESVEEIKGMAWGTSYSIIIVEDSNINMDITSIKIGIDSIINNIDEQMSTYKLNSEISLFNQMPIDAVIKISSGFAEVINRSIYWNKLTSNAFDISVFPMVSLWRKGKDDREYEDVWEPPTDFEIFMEMSKIGSNKIRLNELNLSKTTKGQMLDVNAIAKGWGVDQIFDYLISRGLERFMVEIGGEIRVIGNNKEGKKWKIGIDKPVVGNQPGDDMLAVIALDNKAMATSGNYRNFFEYDNKKYSHIVNPRNGYALQSTISSVSVLGPNCIDADALATALNVMSLDEGKALIDSLDGFEAFWVIKDSTGNFLTESSRSMPIVGGL